MDNKQHNIQIYPKNYFCINCAYLEGVMIPAEVIIWDENDQMLMPLCHECHAVSHQEGKFFDLFSQN